MSLAIDDGEPCRVWKESVSRARKEACCGACRAPIRVGDRYSNTFYVDGDGAPGTIRRCARCEVLYQRLCELHREADDGEEEAVCPRLQCGHTFEQRFGKAPPPELAALAFMTADEAQRALVEEERRP